MEFTDAEFLSAKEKEQTYKQWLTFLKGGLSKEHFTKKIYNHLHLHCGFIAHYDIHGFYATYFESGIDTQTFFDDLIQDGGYGDTQDLTQAMIEAYRKVEDQIKANVEDDTDHRLAVLEEGLKRAKTDKEFAKTFLQGL